VRRSRLFAPKSALLPLLDHPGGLRAVGSPLEWVRRSSAVACLCRLHQIHRVHLPLAMNEFGKKCPGLDTWSVACSGTGQVRLIECPYYGPPTLAFGDPGSLGSFMNECELASEMQSASLEPGKDYYFAVGIANQYLCGALTPEDPPLEYMTEATFEDGAFLDTYFDCACIKGILGFAEDSSCRPNEPKVRTTVPDNLDSNGFCPDQIGPLVFESLTVQYLFEGFEANLTCDATKCEARITANRTHEYPTEQGGIGFPDAAGAGETRGSGFPTIWTALLHARTRSSFDGSRLSSQYTDGIFFDAVAGNSGRGDACNQRKNPAHPNKCPSLSCNNKAQVSYLLEETGDAKKDPHLHLAHGGRADFRGRHGVFYNFFSAPGLAVNLKTEEATSTVRRPDGKTLVVEGSFITEAHLVALVGGEKRKWANASFWASELGENNWGWSTVNGSCGGRSFKLGKGAHKTCDDLSVTVKMARATFEIGAVTVEVVGGRTLAISGPEHRLDVSFTVRGDYARRYRPHGIFGQSFSSPVPRRGRQDIYPWEGHFRTSAMAEGAIEGDAAMYEVASPHATQFRFSRFDAEPLQADRRREKRECLPPHT